MPWEEMREVRHVEKPQARPRLLWLPVLVWCGLSVTDGGSGRFVILEYPHNPTLQIPPQSTALRKKYFRQGLLTVVPVRIQLTRIRLEAEPSNRLLQLRPEGAGEVFI